MNMALPSSLTYPGLRIDRLLDTGSAKEASTPHLGFHRPLPQSRHHTLDVSKLKFVAGSPVATAASKTVESTIFFDKKHNLRNAAYRLSRAFLSLLANEASHDSQFQSVGHAHVADSLFSRCVGVVAHDDRNRACEYTFAPERRLDEARFARGPLRGGSRWWETLPS